MPPKIPPSRFPEVSIGPSTRTTEQSGVPVPYQTLGDAVMQPLSGRRLAFGSVGVSVMMNSTPSSFGDPLLPAVHFTLKALPSRPLAVRHAVTSIVLVWTGFDVTPLVLAIELLHPVP